MKDSARQKINYVIQKFTCLKKHPYKGSQACPKNISDFKAFLVQLCDLAPHNLKELLQVSGRLNTVWEKDWQFYLNMCQARQVGCIAGKDVKLAGKENKKKARICAEETKKEKSGALKRKLEEVVTGDEYDDGNGSEKTAFNQRGTRQDPDMVFHQKIKREKVKLEIDPAKIVEQTTGTFDRLGLSARQSAMVLASLVKIGGGDLAKVPLSKSAVQFKRKKARAKQGKKIMDSFVHSKGGYILHYDTKLVNPKGRDTEDRAAVHKQPYLLGIPKFESSKGKDVEAGVLKELDKYGIELVDCVATCYDTTFSNSGYKEGAHFRIEKQVEHAILELECRKHVYERHVTHANKAVFGATKGPQKAHYKKFKDSWSSLELDTNNINLFDWEKYSEHSFLLDRARQSLAWAEWHLLQNTFPRDDYKELNELIVVHLGGQVPGGFRPKRKGAMHDARFMADSIYLLSMELFSTVYTMDPDLASKVHKMAVFVSVWHGPNFLRCGLACTAPANDLEYFYDMLNLSEVSDPVLSRIGEKVADSIQRHTSYLKAPQVIFALFDEHSPATDRQRLASALSDIPRPDSSPSYFKPGKLAEIPLVCSMKECVGSNLCVNDDGEFYQKKSLPDLVSVRSYLMFNLLKIDDLSWLVAPVALWPCFPSYVQASDFVQQLLTVNDGAERGREIIWKEQLEFCLNF